MRLPVHHQPLAEKLERDVGGRVGSEAGRQCPDEGQLVRIAAKAIATPGEPGLIEATGDVGIA